MIIKWIINLFPIIDLKLSIDGSSHCFLADGDEFESTVGVRNYVAKVFCDLFAVLYVA
jgi:hypothetical protein